MINYKCKWCGSIFIYPLEIKEKFYDKDELKQTNFLALGCNDCGKITFIRNIVETK